MVKHILFFVLTVLCPSMVFALGGDGATCNPSTANWATCTKEEPSWSASASTVINVAGGTYTTPYVMSTANRRYVLQGDVEADGQAFLWGDNYQILDLNGHTVTYNKTAKGSGVAPNGNNRHHLAVINGSFIQSMTNWGAVVTASINGGGTGYTVGDTLTLSGHNVITPATFTVSSVSSGAVTGLALVTPGKGHEVHSTSETYTYRVYNTTGGTGSGATIIVTSTISEGDQYGVGPNPVTKFSSVGTYSVVNDMFVGHLYVRYGGRDLFGILTTGTYPVITQCTVEDTYEFGTLKNRNQGFGAIRMNTDATWGGYGVAKNNTIVNARHRGLDGVNNSDIYGNYITTRAIATNSFGISPGYGAVSNVRIYSNTIIGRGEHTLGVGIGGGSGELGPDNIEVYDNLMDLQITALGAEYASAYLNNPSGTYGSNSASGVRLTWNSYDVSVHDNNITITSDDSFVGTFSPTGTPANIISSGKGLFIGRYNLTNPGVAQFYNNTIVLQGDGLNYGLTCSENYSDTLLVYNNSITSNYQGFVLGNDYGPCNGYPLFWHNTITKTGTNPDFKTIIGSYNSTDRNQQVRLVDNQYAGGASESDIEMQPASSGIVDLYFGDETAGVFTYHTRIHDNNNSSSTLITTALDPAITLPYLNPGETPNSPPGVIITSPVSTPTHSTSTQTISLGGTASDYSAVSSVSWACPTCTPTSGTATDTTSWSFGPITLATGSNTITVTATDDESATGQDILTVTYSISGIVGQRWKNFKLAENP